VSLLFSSASNQNPTIEVDAAKTYQTIDGFGNCLTGGSAMLIHKMDADSRAALLKELFSTDGNSIGVSYLRVSIGTSDLDEKVFSYDDLPTSETDVEMTKFDLGYDKLFLC
jgi:glucosylceramidase